MNLKKIVTIFIVCICIISTFTYVVVNAYADEDNADISKYINLLYSEDMAERREAVTQLRSIGSQTVSALEDVIADKDSDSSTRHSAVRALRGIGGEEVFPVLIKALKDSESQIRSRALTAIGNLEVDKKSAIPCIVELLDDSSSDVRAEASSVLTQMDSEKDMLNFIIKLNY